MDPFRTASLACPRCRAQLPTGELRSCPQCHGIWIPESTLAERVAKMQSQPQPHFAWSVSEERSGLPCTVCQQPMEPLRLFEVPVDRCHAHGVWFDHGELGKVLHRSAQQAKAEGLDDSRWTTAEVAADVGDVALSVAAEAAEAGGSGIVEGVLDVIGGIFSALDF